MYLKNTYLIHINKMHFVFTVYLFLIIKFAKKKLLKIKESNEIKHLSVMSTQHWLMCLVTFSCLSDS